MAENTDNERDVTSRAEAIMTSESRCGTMPDASWGDLLARALEVIHGWSTNAATQRGILERDRAAAMRACGSGSDHTEVRHLAEAIGLAVMADALLPLESGK